MNGFLLGDSNTGTVIFSLPLKPSFGLPGLSGGHFRVPLKNGNYGPSIPPTTTSVQSNFKNNQDRKEQDKGAAAALTAFVFTYLMKSEGVLSDCLSGEQAIGSRRGSKLGKSLPPNNHNNHMSKNRCLTPVFRCINGVTLEIFWHDTLPVFCVTVSTSFDTTGSSLSMGGGGVDVRHTNTLSEFGIRFGSRVIDEAFSPLFGKLLMAYHGKQLAEGQSRRLNGFQDDTCLSTPLFPAEDFFKSSSIKIIKKQMMPIVKLLYRDHTILMICRTIETAGERATIISSCQKKRRKWRRESTKFEAVISMYFDTRNIYSRY